MQTAIQQTISNAHVQPVSHQTLLSRFLTWCEGQDNNRYGWLGGAIASHGCVFTPLTMFAIILSGNSMVFWMLAIIAMMMTLVSNLAAMPTKYTIPIFVFSVLIDAAIVVACAISGFHISGAL